MKKEKPITSDLTVTNQKLIWLYSDSKGHVEEFDTFNEGVDFLKTTYEYRFESVKPTANLRDYVGMWIEEDDITIHLRPVKKINGYQSLSTHECKHGLNLRTPIKYKCTYNDTAIFTPSSED